MGDIGEDNIDRAGGAGDELRCDAAMKSLAGIGKSVTGAEAMQPPPLLSARAA